MANEKKTDSSDEEKQSESDDSTKKATEVDLSEYVPKSKFDELKTQRDELKGKLKTREDADRKKDTDEATKTGDVEKLRTSLEAETKVERERREALERENNDLILQRDAISAFAETVVNPSLALKVLRDELEIVEVDGRKIVRPKNSSKGLKEWAEMRCEQEGIPIKSQRKAGTGAKGTDETNKGGDKPTLDEVKRLSDREQKAAFAKYPELAQEMWGDGSKS